MCLLCSSVGLFRYHSVLRELTMAGQRVACKSQLKTDKFLCRICEVKWGGGDKDQLMTSCRLNAAQTHTPLTPLSFARRRNPSYFGQCHALCAVSVM